MRISIQDFIIKPEFKKLLNAVIELKPKIFITEQICYEIDRNKLNIFRQSIENYLRQISFTAATLPEHLDDYASPRIEEWNKFRKKLEKKIENSNLELTAILGDILKDVSLSQDNVSKALSGIFFKAHKCDKITLEKARFRKDIGNPPGKKTDPLGDQISWEQLLNVIPKIGKLWIVSTDNDYAIEHKNILYLNPVLNQEILKLNPKIEIKIFNILSEALRDFNKEEKISSIPSKEELDEIAKSEVSDLSSAISEGGGFVRRSSLLEESKPKCCPDCGAKREFLDGKMTRNSEGFLIALFICNHCHHKFEISSFFI